MINTAIRHSVTDYGKWKTVYDTYTPVSRKERSSQE